MWMDILTFLDILLKPPQPFTWLFLSSAIENTLDQFAPVKTIVLRQDELFHEAWLTVRMKKCNVKC